MNLANTASLPGTDPTAGTGPGAAPVGGAKKPAPKDLIERARASVRDRNQFDLATRLLPEYAEKLDRLVQSVLTVWDRREKKGNKYTQDVRVAAVRDLDPLLRTALDQFADEFNRLDGPVRELIHLGSAIHEEGRATDLERLELRLRLSEAEAKYLSAKAILAQFAPK